MNLVHLLSAVLRLVAFLSIVFAVIHLTFLAPPEGLFTANRNASLVESAVAGILGGAIWIYHRELARWVLQAQSRPILAGIRVAAIIIAAERLPRSVSAGYLRILPQPEDSYFPGLNFLRGSHAATFTILIITLALLFLSPTVEHWIVRAKTIKRIRAEIEAEDE